MSRKCVDCVRYNECCEIYNKWYSWYKNPPKIPMTERDASYCQDYMTMGELIRQYEKGEDENGL